MYRIKTQKLTSRSSTIAADLGGPAVDKAGIILKCCACSLLFFDYVSGGCGCEVFLQRGSKWQARYLSEW